MNTSKVTVVTSAIFGKIASIVGYVGCCFLLLVVYFAITESNAIGSIFSLLCLAFFVFLVIKGHKIKQRIKRFRQYVSLISTQHITSLENLAASTVQSVDFVRNDLQQMIDKKYFSNASINIAANEIIIDNKAKSEPIDVSAPQQAQSVTQSEFEKFTCSGCGASGTKLKSAQENCNYCGSVV